MLIHLHQACVTRVLKSSPTYQKSSLITRISLLQAGSSKILQTTLPIAVIKSTDIIIVNSCVRKRTLQ